MVQLWLLDPSRIVGYGKMPKETVFFLLVLRKLVAKSIVAFSERASLPNLKGRS